MESKENKKVVKQRDALTYVNDFLTRLNKIILKLPKDSQKEICNIITAILDKNKAQLKKYTYIGIPEEVPILRAFIWKILLNYLPEDPKKWEETLNQKRTEYNTYKKFIKGRLDLEIQEKKYKSKEILEQIIKDVYRTNTDNPFFCELVEKNNTITKEELSKIYEKRKNCIFNNINEIYYTEKKYEIHADVLKRILFIYTSFCPDISYHQGMNELLAPIFYCYSYDRTYKDETEENIEADSFWSFHYLMSKVSLSFVSARKKGLDAKSYIFETCLNFVDEEIYNKLIELNIRSEYYCYRWFILLFSQDFPLNSVIKLWDLIFSNEDIYYYVVYIGIAIMLLKKNVIINGEMVDVMQSLQNFDDIKIDELLAKTKEINNKYKIHLDLFILNTKKVNDTKKEKINNI